MWFISAASKTEQVTQTLLSQISRFAGTDLKKNLSSETDFQEHHWFSPASCKSVWWKWRTRIRPGVNHAGRKVIMCMSTTHNVTSFYSVSRSCWTKGRLDFVIWFQSLPFREVEHLLSSGLCNQPCNFWVLTLLSPSSLTQFRIKVWR